MSAIADMRTQRADLGWTRDRMRGADSRGQLAIRPANNASGLQPLLETPLQPSVVVRAPLVIDGVSELLVLRIGGHQLRELGLEQIERLRMLGRVVEQPREYRLMLGPPDDIQKLHAALRVRASGW